MDFYFEFEQKYRGSREQIKSRLSAYLPFVQKCRSLYADCKALDLGCGRGERLTKIPSRFPSPHRCFFSSSSGIPSFRAASLTERSPD